MASQMAILFRTRTLLSSKPTTTLIKTITTFPFLSQEPQLVDPTPPPSSSSTPLPPNPASGSPLYHENWRSPIPPPPSSAGTSHALSPVGFYNRATSDTYDPRALLDLFGDWMASQQWHDVKFLFESWVRSLDKTGKPNKPDVNLFNHYLRANLMLGASAAELLDLVAQMAEFDNVAPNTASFNLVLKAMCQAKETLAADKLLQRMLQSGNDALPDDESYDLVIGMLFSMGQIDTAFKYIDLILKSGNVLSMKVFMNCVGSCVNKGRLDTLVTIIERCRVYFQLENLNRAEPPYKSVAALNCVILGCANIWDLDRAYQTFESIGSTFGLIPDIHSYNGLMYAFGKLKKTHEATRVFEHLVSLGLKPNAKSYSLLVDAHLINRDVKSALAVIDDMRAAGYEPSKEVLKKVRRRCMREMDNESDARVQSLVNSLNYRLGSENRRDILFNLNYSSMGYA
ncbi:hypothetical protein GLYMA_02G116000v4 [Glycine max]|nr:hypothetical protein GLYMA_02G116000v4 [Glycine max]KAH1059897.1 hypothetical protein GYH30_003738 [Glycine max]